MPTRSLHSSVLKWPALSEVDAAVQAWARREAVRRRGLIRVGYFGSYARGDWGVGSDVDLVAVVDQAARPWAERALEWNLLDLPVPAALLVYTEAEWDALQAAGGRFARLLASETVWVYARP